jgi:hypothetical protein
MFDAEEKSIGFILSEIGHLIDAWSKKKLSISEKLVVLDEKLKSID